MPQIRTEHEPIAIVGIGCRFPKASGPEAFWRVIEQGVDAITEIPADRIDVEALYNATPGTPGKISTRWGGFLDAIETFDAQFFGISPREADRLDPQQRLLLEVAWEALEDGGQVRERLAGTRAGVFIGLWLNDYEARLFRDPGAIDFYMTTGSGRYSASGRVSYALGLEGPSVTVDTACSSSLVAVHLACQSLRLGESTLALAGGANVILEPSITLAYSQSNMMAPDGRCKFGDARGNGYVRSEGAGIVVLKRLSDAVADGDPIYAVILGSAVNNDGNSSGFLATPARHGQEQLLREAYRDAQISPGRVQYVEAHGTGTRAGDPVELGALGTVLADGRTPERPCRIGSVKTNIGHTEGAAGVAGLIKTALALHKRVIPANLHFQDPNPDIPWDQLPVVVASDVADWQFADGAPIAGVSAFGIAGTNAHVVLQAHAPDTDVVSAPARSQNSANLLTLSAQTPEALQQVAATYRGLLAGSQEPMDDVCYSASVRRTHHDHRAAFVVAGREDAVDQIDAFIRGEQRPRLTRGQKTPASAGKVAFVFPGQGSQWIGMGRGLLAEQPLARQILTECDAAIAEFTDWSLLEELTAAEGQSRLDRIDVIQPCIFSMQVTLAGLWRSWGVEPAAVVGHSMGEVAAAYVAGALSLRDAARIICRRSRLLRRTSGKGAMAVVELTFDEATAALAGYGDRLSVAVSNSPRSTVLSGDPSALDEVIAKLEKQETFCRRVKVDVASHSPQMDPLRADLLEALEGLQPRTPEVPVYSTVIGGPSADARFDPAYWVRNLREPVLFLTSVRQLIKDGCATFIEMSPHPILVPAVQEILSHAGAAGLAIGSLRRGENEQAELLGSLGAVYAFGHDVDWARLYPAGGRSMRLPSYPWQRERYWWDAKQSAPRRSSVRDGEHALIGSFTASAVHADTYFWNTELSADQLPFVEHDSTSASAVAPLAVLLEAALAGATQVYGTNVVGLEQVDVQQPLVLENGAPIAVQMVLSRGARGKASFQVLSRRAAAAGDATPWTGHLAGAVDVSGNARSASDAPVNVADIQARGMREAKAGQQVQQLWQSSGEALARLAPSSDESRGTSPVSAADLARCLDVLAGARFEEDAESGVAIPFGIAQLRVHRVPGPGTWCHAVRSRSAEDSISGGNVRLMNEAGEIAIEIAGIGLRMTQADAMSRAFYRIGWELQPLEKASSTPAPSDQRSGWLIFCDRAGIGEQLAVRLESSGEHCIRVLAGDAYGRQGTASYQLNPGRREDFSQLMREVSALGHPPRGIAHLWSLDLPATDVASAVGGSGADSSWASALHLVQALADLGSASAPRLWLVTAGVQATGTDGPAVAVAQSPLWGLGSAIASEHPEFECTRLDLSGSPDDVEIDALLGEFRSPGAETQIALRGKDRYVARLVRWSPGTEIAARVVEPAVVSSDEPCRAVCESGLVESIRFEATPRRAPGAGEIEIEVRAVGLNFMNVLSALHACPGYANGAGPLGIECAGRIVRVGDGVREWREGDEVVAIARDCLGSHAVTDARLAARKPAALTFEDAATLPIAFVTAHYALRELGRLRAGERVLIHSASGGVGLAAVQVARQAGAEVFATAGTEDKREFLRALGIRCVMDSRSTAFADELMAATGGEGVDVVLNSLAGPAVALGLDVLRPYGRFVDLSKRDIHEDRHIGLAPFRKGLSYVAVDIDRMSVERPDVVGSLLRDAVSDVDRGIFQPISAQIFDGSAISEAFTRLAGAEHIGKVVISLQPQSLPVYEPVGHAGNWSTGSYLITGGLGSLGLTVAQWMVEQGARHLVLMGRRGASPAAASTIKAMEEKGASITVARADVSSETELAAVLAQVERSGQPLRGVIHAAGVLDDGILLQLDAPRFRSVMGPKVQGAWNLHTLTNGKRLDFFVMFSSVASFLISAGHGNYATANAFLDALAGFRRSRGLPATCINWGPWAEIGLAAAQSDRLERLSERGLRTLAVADGLKALGTLLEGSPERVTVMHFDARAWCAAPDLATPTVLFAHLQKETKAEAAQANAEIGEEPNLIGTLLAVDAGPQRRGAMEGYLREQVARVLRLTPSRIEINKAFKTMGLDSLMGLEMRNRLEARTGLKIPATLIWNYPTIAQLATQLGVRLGVALDAESAPAPAETAAAPAEHDGQLAALLEEIEELSDDDARRLLVE
jgi:myxalamid-type polyketide synthase MxaB